MTTSQNSTAKCVSLAGVFLLSPGCAPGQTSANTANRNLASIPYATMQVINEGDSDAVAA
jgi:hypothetical protein